MLRDDGRVYGSEHREFPIRGHKLFHDVRLCDRYTERHFRWDNDIHSIPSGMAVKERLVIIHVA